MTASGLGFLDAALGFWEVRYPGPDGMIIDENPEVLELRSDGSYTWSPPPSWAAQTGKWGVVRRQDGLMLCFEEKAQGLRCNYLILSQFEKNGPVSMHWQRTAGDAVIFADRIFRADRPKTMTSPTLSDGQSK